jgi:hypothetical protein
MTKHLVAASLGVAAVTWAVRARSNPVILVPLADTSTADASRPASPPAGMLGSLAGANRA